MTVVGAVLVGIVLVGIVLVGIVLVGIVLVEGLVCAIYFFGKFSIFR